MVFIQFKKNQKNSFVIEASMDTLIHKILAKLLQINNTRIYLQRLTKSVQQLATKGVLKPEQLQGISYDELQKHSKQIGVISQQKQPFLKRPKAEAPNRYVADKANARYGIILPIQQTQILMSAVKKAQELLQPKTQVIEKQEYLNAVDDIRMAIMMTYPGYYGLPSWEPVVFILENKVEVEEMATEEFPFFQQNCFIWFTDKQMDKNKPVSQYSGTNNKTKIIVKLQNIGEQQPPRQSPVDKQSYKNMVQYYYKSKEQHEKFQKESVETIYQKPDWSKKSMRQDVHLQGPIRFRPS